MNFKPLATGFAFLFLAVVNCFGQPPPATTTKDSAKTVTSARPDTGKPKINVPAKDTTPKQQGSGDAATSTSTPAAAVPEGTLIKKFSFTCEAKTSITCIINKTSSNIALSLRTDTGSITKSDYLIVDKVDVDDLTRLLKILLPGSSGCTDKDYLKLITQVVDYVREYQSNSTVSQDKKTIDSLSNLLVDQNRLAGAIHLLKRKIPLYYSFKGKQTSAGSMGKLEINKAFLQLDTNVIYLEVPSVTVQIDYNRLSNVTLNEAVLHIFTAKTGEAALKEIKMQLSPVSNDEFSISFPGLNAREYLSEVPVELTSEIIAILKDRASLTDTTKKYSPQAQIDVKDDVLFMNYGDFLHFEKSGDDLSYIVRNDNFTVKADTLHKVYRRSYADYLSFRTFLDPLGFLGKNPNGFAQLEGDMILPMNLRSRKKHVWVPQAHFNFNYIYSNSINSEPRVAPIIVAYNVNSSTINNQVQQDTLRGKYLHNLDLVKYSYYQFYGRASVYALEVKKWNSWLHVEAGVRALGAKVFTDTTNKNSDSSVIMHKFIPEMNIRLEIRPDYIIGGDVSLGVEYLGNVHEGNNQPGNISNPSFLYNTKWAITNEVNLYALTGAAGKGGFFFRYVGWLAFNKQLASGIDENLNRYIGIGITKTSYFPQILLGYSTNLSTLVKRGTKQP